MRSIALFLPNWIGDVVMSTPAIRAVRNHFPEKKLVAVCKPYVTDVLGGSTWFDEIIPVDKGGPRHFAATVQKLAKQRPNTAILFPNSLRIAILARLAGCRRIIGFARYGRDALLSDRLYPTRGRSGRLRPTPVIDDYNRLVRRLGVPDPEHRMELFTTPADEAEADSFWATNRLHRYTVIVGLNPGGAFGTAKHWPVDHFTKLAHRFAARGFGVLILCGPAERDVARAISAAVALPNVISLAETTLSLGKTKACVHRLTALVATDSGPRHFAAAFGVPVVTLFGPTHIGWTETYYDKAVHLQKELPCGPCQQRICPLGHHRCMSELGPDDVYTAVVQLIGKTSMEARHAS